MSILMFEHNQEHTNEILAGLAAVIAAEMKTRDAANNLVLDKIRTIFTSDQIEELMEYLEDSGCVDNFQITDKPTGHKENDNYSWGTYYVNQTCNGGHTGDDFAGTVSIPLGNGQYFQFDYSM